MTRKKNRTNERIQKQYDRNINKKIRLTQERIMDSRNRKRIGKKEKESKTGNEAVREIKQGQEGSDH